MKCPVCRTDLSPYSYGDETINVCLGCHGIWFDPAELSMVAKQMIQNGEVADQEARDAFEVIPRLTDGDELEKMCPRCGVPTKVFNYAYDSNVFLNRCTTCRGVWTDEEELQRVAQHLKGNPAVNRYAQSLMTEVEKAREQGLISRLMTSRLLSGMVALVYLGGAMATGNSEIIWKMAMFLVLPLACIWFSNAMGGYTGLLSLPRPPITQRSPGDFVALAGWIVLLTPLVLAMVLAVRQFE